MDVRLYCGIAVMCLLSSTAAAQTGLRSPALPDRTPSNPTPPQMLRSASLPDRTPTQPIPPLRSDQFLAGPDTYATPPDRVPRHRHRRGFSIGYGYAPYSFAAPEPRDAMEMLPNGYLHLQLQPGNAQVYVDGFYMGSVDDFRRIIPGRALEAGAHRVEMRAPGYQTTAFDVLIPSNETIAYRTDLLPVGDSVKVVAASPGTPKTFYVIPGCYAGDKPPRARLPRGCDRSKVRTIPPQPILSVKR
jgi:hypothetical protein